MNDLAALILMLSIFFVGFLFCIFMLWWQEQRDHQKDALIVNHVANARIASQKQLIVSDVRQKVLEGAYSSWQKASSDLTTVFPSETNHLRLVYPELTDMDICVLQLLAIGLDNQEILTFMDMTKRTFYKRRQLIAGRVGLLASQLDQFAYANLPKNTAM